MILNDGIVKIFQVACYLLTYIPFRIFYSLRATAKGELRIPAKKIVIANHQGRLDPFLACSALPFRKFLKLTPIYFMTADSYLHGPMKFLLCPLGCYPAYSDEKGALTTILTTLSLIENGKTVFAFPEGRISPQRAAPKRGIPFIIKRAGAHFLPIKLSRTKNMHNNIFSLDKINVYIGKFKTFDGKELNAEELLDEIYGLSPKV